MISLLYINTEIIVIKTIARLTCNPGRVMFTRSTPSCSMVLSKEEKEKQRRHERKKKKNCRDFW